MAKFVSGARCCGVEAFGCRGRPTDQISNKRGGCLTGGARNVGQLAGQVDDDMVQIVKAELHVSKSIRLCDCDLDLSHGRLHVSQSHASHACIALRPKPRPMGSHDTYHTGCLFSVLRPGLRTPTTSVAAPRFAHIHMARDARFRFWRRCPGCRPLLISRRASHGMPVVGLLHSGPTRARTRGSGELGPVGGHDVGEGKRGGCAPAPCRAPRNNAAGPAGAPVLAARGRGADRHQLTRRAMAVARTIPRI